MHGSILEFGNLRKRFHDISKQIKWETPNVILYWEIYDSQKINDVNCQ